MRDYSRRNRYEIDGDIARLTITRRDGTEHVVTIDAADVPAVRRRLWRVDVYHDGYCYAMTGVGKRSLASYLLAHDPTTTSVVSYLGDTLDCRRSMIRISDRSEVARLADYAPPVETGRHRNIRLTESGTYEVAVKRHGRDCYVGRYRTIAEAIAARDGFLRGERVIRSSTSPVSRD